MDNKLPIRISGADLAGLLGISVQRVDQLRREGRIEKNDDGYLLKETIQSYCENLREVAAGRLGDGETEEGRIDPVQAGARLKLRQAEMVELKLAKARAEVMTMSDMMNVMGRVVGAVRTKLMGLSSSLPTQIHGLKRDEILVIQNAVRKILDEFVEDASKVQEQVQNLALEDD